MISSNNSTNIKNICIERNISFNEVAKQMHITPRKLREFELNPGNMDIIQVKQLSTT